MKPSIRMYQKKYFETKTFVGKKFSWDQNICTPKFFWLNCLTQKFFGPKNVLDQQNVFLTNIFFGLIFLWTKMFLDIIRKSRVLSCSAHSVSFPYLPGVKNEESRIKTIKKLKKNIWLDRFGLERFTAKAYSTFALVLQLIYFPPPQKKKMDGKYEWRSELKLARTQRGRTNIS